MPAASRADKQRSMRSVNALVYSRFRDQPPRRRSHGVVRCARGWYRLSAVLGTGTQCHQRRERVPVIAILSAGLRHAGQAGSTVDGQRNCATRGRQCGEGEEKTEDNLVLQSRHNHSLRRRNVRPRSVIVREYNAECHGIQRNRTDLRQLIEVHRGGLISRPGMARFPVSISGRMVRTSNTSNAFRAAGAGPEHEEK